MNSLKTIDKRRLIPRWQSMEDALNSGELLHYKIAENNDNSKVGLLEEIEKAKKEWINEKSLFTAIEYLGKQRMINDYDMDAYEFVKKEILQNNQLPYAIKKFFDDDNAFDDTPPEPKSAINNIRKQTILNSDDAYLWLELARNYLVLGLTEKCEKTLLIARSLAPNDRYIARSLMRFYHHVKNIDKALYYTRKMGNLVHDPMLLSGEIALSNIIGRTSKNIKHAKYMVESKNYSPLSLSELTSEIATMEILNGKERIGKRLLEQSVVNPTENSFAQATWINQNVIKLSWIDGLNSTNLSNNFEGKIYIQFASHDVEIDWSYLYKQCILWSNYQPFSCEPIYLGGAIATDFLEQYQDAFDLSKKALMFHKDDTGLLNNIAYSAILNNDSENAFGYLQQQHSKTKTDEDKVIYFATKGLFEYRFGSVETGKELYQRSYELAKKMNSELYAKVLVHYYRELDRCNDLSGKSIVKNAISNCNYKANDFMLIQLIKKFNIFG